MHRGRYAGGVETPLTIYNTATRREEQFRVAVPGKARGYVCGLTPQDHPHVGHARVYVVFDVFRRLLEYLGIGTTLVINFTDIDDKIIDRARKEYGDRVVAKWYDVPRRYIEEYFEVMDALNVKRADHYPRVTEYVDKMVKWIEDLVERGYAYVAPDGSVYFDVFRVPRYGELSGQRVEELVAGARVEPEPGKRNPLDFALWKSWAPLEPWWNSPWCPGRPGWHLECVVMSSTLLGVPFDFHGGGQDLMFPHHENEVAIARVYFGVDYFARYWIHVGYLTIGGEKMSKSLGNIVTVREVLGRYMGEEVRLALLSAHYRKPLDFSTELLDAQRPIVDALYSAYDQLVQALNDAKEQETERDAEAAKALDYHMGAFEEALLDDLKAHIAVGKLYEYARHIVASVIPSAEKLGKAALARTLEGLLAMADVLGLVMYRDLPQEVVDFVSGMVEYRSTLRRERRFEVADTLRALLERFGVRLFDYGPITRWSLDRRAARWMM